MRSTYLNFARPSGSEISVPVCTVCILDQSISMLSTDYFPSRLAAAIEAIKAMLKEKKQRRPKDRMGVVGFGDKGFCVCRLTSVQKDTSINKTLARLGERGSTNFVAGLEIARKLLDREAGVKKQGFFESLFGASFSSSGTTSSFGAHCVFLSDGDNNGSGDPVETARAMKELGIFIDCVGIGVRPSDVDEACLKAMASIGHDGQPRYRFIGDVDSLIQDFRRMATLKIC